MENKELPDPDLQILETGEKAPPLPPRPFLPVCPHCLLDPCVPEMIPATYGKWGARIFCCPNRECRKVFSVELLGEMQPRA